MQVVAWYKNELGRGGVHMLIENRYMHMRAHVDREQIHAYAATSWGASVHALCSSFGRSLGHVG